MCSEVKKIENRYFRQSWRETCFPSLPSLRTTHHIPMAKLLWLLGTAQCVTFIPSPPRQLLEDEVRCCSSVKTSGTIFTLKTFLSHTSSELLSEPRLPMASNSHSPVWRMIWFLKQCLLGKRKEVGSRAAAWSWNIFQIWCFHFLAVSFLASYFPSMSASFRTWEMRIEKFTYLMLLLWSSSEILIITTLAANKYWVLMMGLA